MAVGDIWQVRVFTRLRNQQGLNVRHFRVAAEVTGGATATEIATQIEASVVGPIRTLLTAQAFYDGVDAQKVFPPPPTQVGQAGAFGQPGLVAGDALPSQTAGIIRLRTMFAGRRFRGRVYIPFPGEADSTIDAFPTPAYIANALTYRTVWTTTYAVGGATGATTLVPVIFHRGLGTADVITNGVVIAGWATQRRRGFFGRPNT